MSGAKSSSRSLLAVPSLWWSRTWPIRRTLWIVFGVAGTLRSVRELVDGQPWWVPGEVAAWWEWAADAWDWLQAGWPRS